MNPQLPETDLFEITLSQQGAGWLLRLIRLTRWVFIISILFSILLLICSVFRYQITDHYNSDAGGDWLAFTEAKIIPIYMAVSTVLGFIQVYFFYYFSRLCKKSIESQQTDLFNESFKWLFRNSLTALILFVINLIFTGIIAYRQYLLLRKIGSLP